MNTKVIKTMVLLSFVVLLMLYLAEWIAAKIRPVALVVQVTNAPAGTNMSYGVRDHLGVALAHVKAELGSSTNSRDIQVLRQVEAILTNALTNP
jgi:hypothetical protein